MFLLVDTLRKLLSNDLSFCCLCFENIEYNFFNLNDEINFENNTTKTVYEVLCVLFGDKVPSVTNLICNKCTEMAINSYKFIEQCQNNIENLSTNINCLLKCEANVTKDHKTLFLTLDSCDGPVNINSIYDTEQHENNKTLLMNRLQYFKEQQLITTISNLIPIDFELEHHADQFQCPTCPRKFDSMKKLKRHTSYSHCTVVCCQCGKTYNNVYSLRHHEKTHKENFICQICGKVYKNKFALKNHVEQALCDKKRKSNSEAQFHCIQCEKKYSHKNALQAHIRLVHENGKAYVCDWCDKKFGSKSKLTEHIVVHTKQKNFTCNICQEQFASKTALLYHTRLHTGERPYHCEHCDMKFLSASRKSQHIQTYHMGPDLQCEICHRKYKGQLCFQRHLRRHLDPSSKLYKPSIVEKAFS